MPSLPAKYRFTAGICCLLMTVVIWVTSSNVIQYVFEDLSYDAPFFVTYLSTTMFSLYLTGFVSRGWRDSGDRIIPPSEDGSKRTIREYSPKRVFLIAIKFCPLWVGGNWSFNSSLALTSVSSNTIISSTSGLFTFILGIVILKEKFSWRKLAAVGISFAGVCFIALADEESRGGESILGDMLAFCGAFCYGLYTTVLRREIPDERAVRMPMFLGFLGLFNACVLWPLFPILSATGVEPWDWPSNEVWMFLVLNAVIGTMVSELCWTLAVLLTSPLIATVGLSLSIPLALLSDILIRHIEFSWMYFVGSACVICGFVLVNWSKKTLPQTISNDASNSDAETAPLAATASASLTDTEESSASGSSSTLL
eukprot:ANDGO_07915.mRNA.1 putative vacuolar membrane protein YML018C